MELWTTECPKCKGKGTIEKTTIKKNIKGIKIYNNRVLKGWEAIK